MKTKSNYEKILELFVSKDEMRDWMCKTIIDFDGELFLDCCGREKEYITQEQKDAIIKEYLKDKVFVGNDLQYRFKTEDWSDCPDSCGYEYRIKPHPDYTKEIETLLNKAKDNGQRLIIKFE